MAHQRQGSRRSAGQLSISTAVNQNTASGSESETAGVLPALLPQRDTGHLPDANAADAVKATVNFQSGGATGFVYDDALAAYGMLHADGTPQLDANTGTQAVFDNLLILYSGSSMRDDGRTLDYDLSMGGGVWLNGGHCGRSHGRRAPRAPLPSTIPTASR